MNCDSCKHFRWYYDRCDKWGIQIDWRSVHNCFEPMTTPVLDTMKGVKAIGTTQISYNK